MSLLGAVKFLDLLHMGSYIYYRLVSKFLMKFMESICYSDHSHQDASKE